MNTDMQGQALLAELRWCMDNAGVSERVRAALSNAYASLVPAPDHLPPARDRILSALKRGPMTTGQLSKALQINRSTARRVAYQLIEEGQVSMGNTFESESGGRRVAFTLKDARP